MTSRLYKPVAPITKVVTATTHAANTTAWSWSSGAAPMALQMAELLSDTQKTIRKKKRSASPTVNNTEIPER
jgi:hypothetical protein